MTLSENRRNTREHDPLKTLKWNYRGPSAAAYLDIARKPQQPYSLTHRGPRKGLAVIVGLIVVGAVVLWRVW